MIKKCDWWARRRFTHEGIGYPLALSRRRPTHVENHMRAGAAMKKSRSKPVGAIITPDGNRHEVRLLTAGRARQIIKPYARLIGTIAIHWNWLHENLASLFELVIRSPDQRMAHAIWYAAENDFVQRKMLRNSLKYASHLTPQQKE